MYVSRNSESEVIFIKICTNKACASQGEPQPRENFYANSGTRDGLTSWCKACTKDRRQNRGSRREKWNRKRGRRKTDKNFQNLNLRFLAALRELRSCEVCGEDDPSCLDFHVEGKAAVDLNSNLQWNSLSEVRTVILQSRTLCANCHRKHNARHLRPYGIHRRRRQERLEEDVTLAEVMARVVVRE